MQIHCLYYSISDYYPMWDWGIIFFTSITGLIVLDGVENCFFLFR